MNTVRDNIPIDNILRAYIDETEEKDVQVEEHEEVVPIEVEKEVVDITENKPDSVQGGGSGEVVPPNMSGNENIKMEVNDLKTPTVDMEHRPNIKFNNMQIYPTPAFKRKHVDAIFKDREVENFYFFDEFH